MEFKYYKVEETITVEKVRRYIVRALSEDDAMLMAANNGLLPYQESTEMLEEPTYDAYCIDEEKE